MLNRQDTLLPKSILLEKTMGEFSADKTMQTGAKRFKIELN